MTKFVALIDIDNCFMDSRSLLNKYAGDWDMFAKNLSLAKPNKAFIDFILETQKVEDFIPIFTTGREDREGVLETTISQIEEGSEGRLKVGENCYLFLREKGDYRKNYEVKKDMLEAIRTQYYPILAVDDDKNTCAMYAENGVPIVKYYDITNDGYYTVEV